MKKYYALLLLASAVCGITSGTVWAQTPSETQVKAAITRVLTKPSTALMGDMQDIVNFADKSDKVNIQIVPGIVPLGSSAQDKETTPIFLGYFLAGAVQYDLAHPKLAKDQIADQAPGVRAMLIGYRALQKKNPGYKQPILEKWAALEKSGKLDATIRAELGTKKSK